MGQWTPAQVHDTVAAIVAQPHFATQQRQSLFVRFVRFVFSEIRALLDLMRGSIDGRIIVVAALLVIALIVVARIVADRRLALRRRLISASVGSHGGRRDGWATAREMAAQGQLVEASHVLYSVLLEALSRAGAIRFHASKTAGDYARELRHAGVPTASDFRAFAREFDRAVYGRGTVTRAEFDALLQAAEQIAGITSRQRAA